MKLHQISSHSVNNQCALLRASMLVRPLTVYEGITVTVFFILLKSTSAQTLLDKSFHIKLSIQYSTLKMHYV